ncbi:unnamed protein product [marine sediment metagenome]|uniref:Methyltransferase type 11 domain-containing protein n=1 Tax=marine sediment metagenome TaxID=412755 RepID=X0UYU3_9ZZZZ
MLKLHVGCGSRVLKGWVNVDLGYHTGVGSMGDKWYPLSVRGDKSDMLIMDATKEPLPFSDNSVDIVFHEDFIEHLCQRDQIVFLAETLRVLKFGSGHRVNTPNLLQVQRRSDFSLGFRGVRTSPEWDRWKHKNVLTRIVLEELALMVGYSRVVFNARDQSVFAEYLPLEFRPGRDRKEDENLFADLIK